MRERLWAPWRLEYVQTADSTADGCFLCRLPDEADASAHILRRGERAYVMLNAFPYTSGHLMVAPYRHLGDLRELGKEELAEIDSLLQEALGWLEEAYGPEAFNIGVNMGRAAGAGAPGHIHWHIVPRWTGDTNYVTVLSETRVLPELLSQTYERLRPLAERAK